MSDTQRRDERGSAGATGRTITRAPVSAGARWCARWVLSAAAVWGALGPAPAAWAQPAGVDEEHVRLIALDRSGIRAGADGAETPRGTLFIGSSANDWNPRGTWSMGHVTPTGDQPGGWMFEIPREVVEAGLEFKFTRGSWETVEVGPDGRDIGDRELGGVFGGVEWGGTSPSFPPEVTLVVEGFADQRGTRWNWEGRGGEGEGEPAGDRTVTGGVLTVFEIESEVLGGAGRVVRVWKPDGYEEAATRGERLPVMYMLDGQNVFDEGSSAFGMEWGADEAVSELTAAGALDPMLVVGLDNSGLTRALDYLPVDPGARRPEMRGGGLERYMRHVVEEVIPEVESRYSVVRSAEGRGLGGSSFGGVAALVGSMGRGDVFGRVLVESPSLWVGDGAVLRLVREAPAGGWPERVALAMGSAEYGRASDDARLVELTRELAAVLRSRGLGPGRLRVEIEEGARHNERAWAGRLGRQLAWLWGSEAGGSGPE